MIKKTPGGKLLPILGGLLLLLLLLAAASVYLLQQGSLANQGTSAALLERQLIASNTALLAQQAVTGDESAFDGLQASLQRMDQQQALRVGDDLLPVVNAISGTWSQMRANTSKLLKSREALMIAQNASAAVVSGVPELLTEMGSLAALPGQASLIDKIPAFEIQAQRLQQDAALLAVTPENTDGIATRMAAADEYLGQFVRALSTGDSSMGISAVTGSAAIAKLEEVNSLYQRITSSVRESIISVDELGAARDSAGLLAGNSDAIIKAAASLRSRLDGQKLIQVPPLAPFVLIGAALLTFLLMSLLIRKAVGAQKAAVFEAEQNTQNQDAILRLLDELSSLADGDLTVQATVSEDITGAIADSINYAIEALRDLVTTIDEAASQVDEAARQTQASAAHLANASENQSRQVKSATQSIADMAESIEEVSHNAERSSDVSRHSVEIAHKGGEAVRRTIDGMNTIRETIQETSKRIKRLGESSQEIGNIVELINDIAEQTNILALNASIQASMAGEAGRGFAVVADEVQRLAERSANATKQIEVLVNTIQSDTNEAVVSMERSTTDVVSGALLAENAGSALDEIEKVSNQIASLVQNISGTARTQATAAADMTRNMGVLQEISSQTADGSNATSTAIGKLAEMAKELRRSVAGFTLPDKMSPSVAAINPPQRKAPEPATEATD